jgi:hypothetical protein
MLGSAAGAVVFGLLRNWTGFILFAVSTLLATAQLIRIGVRARASGSGTGRGRRW